MDTTSSANRKQLKLQPDSTTKDLLRFEDYAQALNSMIDQRSGDDALTVGVYGRWGTGKTTLLKSLQAKLESAGYITIWFEAWQYSQEDEMWAAFLQSLVRKVRAELCALQTVSFEIEVYYKRIRWNELLLGLLKYSLRLGVALVPAKLIDPVVKVLDIHAAQSVNWIAAGASAGLAVWLVLRPLIETVQQQAPFDFSQYVQKTDYEAHIAFLDRFHKDFSDLVDSLPAPKRKKLAVLIDDLDRCTPDKVLGVLDALRAFLNIPGCVYVLGLDSELVERAVLEKFPEDLIAQREYLSKIVQLPFQLPILSDADLQTYLREIAINLPKPECQEVLRVGMPSNPRSLKRAVNMFAFIWNLAAVRPDVAHIEAVRLCKVIVIQQAFPKLYSILRTDPSLLSLLESYYRQADELRDDDYYYDTMFSTDAVRAEPGDLLVLPESLREIAKEPRLVELLTMHPVGETAVDDNNFANLDTEEISIYFTLARVTETSQTLAVVDGKFETPIEARFKQLDNLGADPFDPLYLAQPLNNARESVMIHTLSLKESKPMDRISAIAGASRSALGLNAPGLVDIRDVGFDQPSGCVYWILAPMRHGSLARQLERTGRLTVKQTLVLAESVLESLHYLHQKNIVMGVLRPALIMADDINQPKLAPVNELHVLRVLGLPDRWLPSWKPYLAPEMVSGARAQPASDIYSLGMVIYRCLTGSVPQIPRTSTTEDPRAFAYDDMVRLGESNPDIMPEMQSALERLYVRCPAVRYPSAYDALMALREA